MEQEKRWIFFAIKFLFYPRSSWFSFVSFIISSLLHLSAEDIFTSVEHCKYMKHWFIQGVLFSSHTLSHLINMPLHCFFVGLILSIDGVGSYKTAQVLVTDGEGDNHEVSVKYYQSNENNLTVDSIYMISSTCILQLSKLPQVMQSCFILANLFSTFTPIKEIYWFFYNISFN